MPDSQFFKIASPSPSPSLAAPRAARAALQAARLVALVLAFQVAAFAQAIDPIIKVRAETSVDSADGMRTQLMAGDITEFSGLADEEIKAFREIKLADWPSHGERIDFSAQTLSHLFREQLKRLEERKGQSIRLRIPSKVTVNRELPRLRAAEVEARLVADLKQICGECEPVIDDLKMPAPRLELPAGATWSLSLRGLLPKGHFSVPLEIRHDDGTRRLYWINGRASLFARVPVAKRAIGIGEKVHEVDVEFTRRDITFAADTAASGSDLKSSWAGRAFPAGEIILRSWLKRESAATAGQAVKVVTGGEAYQVSVEGVTQQAGSVGDMIRVRIPRTQKVLSGILVDKGVVEVR